MILQGGNSDTYSTVTYDCNTYDWFSNFTEIATAFIWCQFVCFHSFSSLKKKTDLLYLGRVSSCPIRNIEKKNTNRIKNTWECVSFDLITFNLKMIFLPLFNLHLFIVGSYLKQALVKLLSSATAYFSTFKTNFLLNITITRFEQQLGGATVHIVKAFWVSQVISL